HLVAIIGAVVAGNQKDHIAVFPADAFGDFHEDVEPANRFQPARGVSDDARIRPDRNTAKIEWPRNIAAFQRLDIDTIKDRVQLRLEHVGCVVKLKAGWRIAYVHDRAL